ncbi:MAG: hypothetical protein NC250_00885 [Alistipes senegalensis]|nr:hypothetical protein [Bacteroides cellulosilyticus]MCM1351275.1 hypothetical protein [Alistipes senegalensis]
MKRAYYDALPPKFEAVGNGSYIYRWDIQEEVTPMRLMAEGDEQPIAEASHTQYSCYEVIVWATVTSNKITEAVIGQMWEANYEQKLINEYNAANLGVYGGSKTSNEAKAKIAAYKEFLAARATLKTQIDADCAELNIE